jgi:hypothetical protein
MEDQAREPYCREINIQDEPIAKSTISVLFSQSTNLFIADSLTESMEEKASKALSNPISALAFIYRITS